MSIGKATCKSQVRKQLHVLITVKYVIGKWNRCRNDSLFALFSPTAQLRINFANHLTPTFLIAILGY